MNLSLFDEKVQALTSSQTSQFKEYETLLYILASEKMPACIKTDFQINGFLFEKWHNEKIAFETIELREFLRFSFEVLFSKLFLDFEYNLYSEVIALNEKLLRSYEVKKKLNRKFNKTTFKSDCKFSVGISDYIFLEANFLMIFMITGDYRFLNAALKLVDKIESKPEIHIFRYASVNEMLKIKIFQNC